MDQENIQLQIDGLNQKLDLLLEYMTEQRQKHQVVEDLVTDVSLIGKDVFVSAVDEFENQGVQIDYDQMKLLFFKMMKNVDNFTVVLGMFESIIDLMKDVGPIANEMIIDFTKVLHKAQERGYIDFMVELGKVADNIVTNFSKEDVQALADNVVTILQTVKNLTQPDMLLAINNAVSVFKSIEMENVPEYSVFKLMRELRSPEMKRGLGFMVTLMKNLANTEGQK